jgi:membrane protein implicated in regulation of membrane protease activity
MQSEEEKMSKWLKVAVFAALLMGAGYFFGRTCGQIGQAYELILAPSGELLTLLLWFLLALGAVLVSAGLIAALLRPVWVGFIAFALSGLSMLLGWQVTVGSGILVLVYLLAASFYAVRVARQMDERIRFSVRPISEGQGILLMALILVACGSLYLGYAAHIEREGFSVPEFYIEMFMKQMEEQVETPVPAEERQEAVAKFREEFRRAVGGILERTIKPYERFIPLAIAVGLLMSLVTITSLLAWVPTLALSVIFRLLTALGVTKVVTETQEVQRLIID